MVILYMSWYTDLVTYLYNDLPKVKVEVPRSKLLKDYYNNKYPSSPIFYGGRVLRVSNKRFNMDVRDFFSLNDEVLKNIVNGLKMGSMTDNQKALTCLKWVITNFPYVSDNNNYSTGEFWSMPFEAIAKRSGDCEDGSILLANMLLISGIPNWKIRINCGHVFEPTTKQQVGHAYTTFFDEENEKWVILDWCYYPNIKKIIDREEYKKETMYQDVWFSFNNEFGWANSNGDVRKMEGFKDGNA